MFSRLVAGWLHHQSVHSPFFWLWHHSGFGLKGVRRMNNQIPEGPWRLLELFYIKLMSKDLDGESAVMGFSKEEITRAHLFHLNIIMTNNAKWDLTTYTVQIMTLKMQRVFYIFNHFKSKLVNIVSFVKFTWCILPFVTPYNGYFIPNQLRYPTMHFLFYTHIYVPKVIFTVKIKSTIKYCFTVFL